MFFFSVLRINTDRLMYECGIPYYEWEGVSEMLSSTKIASVVSDTVKIGKIYYSERLVSE